MKKLLVLFMAITLTGCSAAEASTNPEVPTDPKSIPASTDDRVDYLNKHYPISWTHVVGNEFTADDGKYQYNVVIEDQDIELEFDILPGDFDGAIMETKNIKIGELNPPHTLELTIELKWDVHKSFNLTGIFTGTYSFNECSITNREGDITDPFLYEFDSTSLSDSNQIIDIDTGVHYVDGEIVADLDNIIGVCT